MGQPPQHHLAGLGHTGVMVLAGARRYLVAVLVNKRFRYNEC